MSDRDGHLRERPLSRRTAFDGALLHVAVDTVALPSGKEATREVVTHPGAVAVVASDEAGRVVLVRQWRHAAGRALWEIPAGTRESDEEPTATARRELTEETGFAAEHWRDLGHGPVSPGYSTEEIWFYAARGLTAGQSTPDVDELFDVQLFSADQLADLAGRGDIDLKTLAGLALAGFNLAGRHG